MICIVCLFYLIGSDVKDINKDVKTKQNKMLKLFFKTSNKNKLNSTAVVPLVGNNDSYETKQPERKKANSKKRSNISLSLRIIKKAVQLKKSVSEDDEKVFALLRDVLSDEMIDLSDSTPTNRSEKETPAKLLNNVMQDPEITEIKQIILDLVKTPTKMHSIFQKLDREHSHGLTHDEFHLFVNAACKKVGKELNDRIFKLLWSCIEHHKVNDHDELEAIAIEKWLFTEVTDVDVEKGKHLQLSNWLFDEEDEEDEEDEKVDSIPTSSGTSEKTTTNDSQLPSLKRVASNRTISRYKRRGSAKLGLLIDINKIKAHKIAEETENDHNKSHDLHMKHMKHMKDQSRKRLENRLKRRKSNIPVKSAVASFDAEHVLRMRINLAKKIGSRMKLEKIVERLDKEQDGTLSHEEFNAMLYALDVTADKATVMGVWEGCWDTVPHDNDTSMSVDIVWKYISGTEAFLEALS